MWRCSWCGIENESALCPRCGKEDAVAIDPNAICIIRCEHCGIEKGDGDASETFQLLQERPAYLCPDCYHRHSQVKDGRFRVWSFLLAVLLFFFALVAKRELLNVVPVFLAAVFVFQAFLIIPHELGHALVARAFHYPDIRIFIGFGKPLLIFRLFGFQWVLNSIPVGGLTHAALPDSIRSWQFLCYASGGLIVNLFLVLLCVALLPSGFFQDGEWTWLEALLYANVVLIIENLTPHTILTHDGKENSDGMLLWRALFRRNTGRLSDNGEPLKGGKLLKWIAVGLLTLAALFFASLTCLSAFREARLGGGPQFIMAAVTAMVSSLFGAIAWKIYKEPGDGGLLSPELAQRSVWRDFVKQFDSSVPINEIQELIAKLEAQEFQVAIAKARDLYQAHPNDLRLLVLYVFAFGGNSEHKEAEVILDRLLDLIPSDDKRMALLMGQKLQTILCQADVERFLATCKIYCATTTSNAIKVAQLDHLACTPLYMQLPEEKRCIALEFAEFCARKALELAPNKVTLKGTLGGCLVERGYFDEAEPLLRECYHTGSMQDRAICSLFLGLLAERRNDWPTAVRFARESTILLTPPLLAQRAKDLRERLAKRKESAKI